MIRRLRSLLAVPQAYQLFWNVTGGPARSKILMDGTCDPDRAIGSFRARAARYLVARDREEFVRREEHYRRLGSRAFPTPRSSIRRCLLRIPHTHLSLEGVR